MAICTVKKDDRFGGVELRRGAYPGRLLSWHNNVDTKEAGQRFRALLLGHWQALQGMSESGDEATRKAVEDRCTTIARVFGRTILKLTEEEWTELQARCPGFPNVSSDAVIKTRIRMYSVLTDTNTLKARYGSYDMKLWRAVLKNFRPNWKAFWTAYQSLFGGVVDPEVAFLAGTKADALQYLFGLMFSWSSPMRMGEATTLSYVWDDIQITAHANK